jgi:septum site-determining protein MinD
MTSDEIKKGKVISVISVKGGVGKTTISTNLGMILSKNYNLRCLVIDGDLKLPTVGFHLDIIEPGVTIHDFLKSKSAIIQAVQTHSSGLHVILGSLSDENTSSEKLREGIQEIAKQYDYVILDTSPSIDADLKNMIISSDEVIVVSGPDYPSISGSMKAVKLAKELNIPVRGAVINHHDGADDELAKETAAILEVPVLAIIPEDPKVREALTRKQPVILYSPNSPAGKEMVRLAEEIMGIKAPKPGFFSKLINFIKRLFGN